MIGTPKGSAVAQTDRTVVGRVGRVPHQTKMQNLYRFALLATLKMDRNKSLRDGRKHVFNSRMRMNKVLLIGRLTRDLEVRYSGENNDKAVAKYTLAVERRFKREGDDTVDFVGITAFGKGAEFSENTFARE